MNGTTITAADLLALGEEYSVEILSVNRAKGGWQVEYEWGYEDYDTGEQACEAIRAYGSGSR